MQSTCYYCQILSKLEFSPQIFKKFSNIKFHETLFSGSPVVPREHICNTANCAISGFRCEVAENRTLLGYYTVSNGNYHCLLCTNPKEHGSPHS